MDRVWGYAPWPDHWNRRCVDFMVPTWEDGQWLSLYLPRWQHQLNVKYLIWDRRQWRDYPKPGVPERTWAKYWGRSPHTDHVHVEFWL